MNESRIKFKRVNYLTWVSYWDLYPEHPTERVERDCKLIPENIKKTKEELDI